MMPAKLYDARQLDFNPDGKGKTNVLHQADNFKIRVIELSQGESIPPCEMSANVIFQVLSGAVDIIVNGETVSLVEGQGIVSDPATISMSTSTGARLLGVQINSKSQEARIER